MEDLPNLGGDKPWSVSAAYSYLINLPSIRLTANTGQRRATKQEVEQLELDITNLDLETSDGDALRLGHFSALKSSKDQRVNVWEVWQALNLLYMLKN